MFNTYGLRMDLADARVIAGLTEQGPLDKPLPVFGDGAQAHSFRKLDDPLDDLVRAMDIAAQTTGPIQLAQVIVAMAGIRSSIEFLPLPPDARQPRPDIRLAEGLLGSTPTTTRSEGLGRTGTDLREWLVAATSATPLHLHRPTPHE